jgi:hypothetical protein
MKQILALFFLSFFIHPTSLIGQCCSMGSPTGTTSSFDLPESNSLRTTVFHKYNFLDTYYEDSKISSLPSPLKSANYNFTGINVAYGLSKRTSLELDAGYFINKTQHYVFNNNDYYIKSRGLSNAQLQIKHGFLIKPPKEFSITGGLGIKLPLSFNPYSYNGTRVPIDLQPSTIAFGAGSMISFIKGYPKRNIRLYFVHQFIYNFQNAENYKYGANITSNFVFRKEATKNSFLFMILKNEYRFKDISNGIQTVNTGGNILFGALQFTYTFKDIWIAGINAETPMSIHFEGRQLAPKLGIAISITRSFLLKSKKTQQ